MPTAFAWAIASACRSNSCLIELKISSAAPSRSSLYQRCTHIRSARPASLARNPLAAAAADAAGQQFGEQLLIERAVHQRVENRVCGVRAARGLARSSYPRSRVPERVGSVPPALTTAVAKRLQS